MNSRTQIRSTAVALSAATAAASPEHKRFRSLLARIEKERARLAVWQRELPLYATLHAERVAPAERELTLLRRAWAFELEDILNGQRWPRQDAQTLADLIAANALATLQDLSSQGEEADAELESLYERHTGISLAEEAAGEVGELKRMLEQVSGVELPASPEDMPLEDVLKQVHEHLLGEEAAQQARDAERDAQREARRAKRRAAKPSAAQRKAEEAERRISQTVREVYRKLAGALHPDRIGNDASAAARDLATRRMQRANAAYEAGDLLALLSLQLEIEQVDAEHLAGVGVEQVKHFNRVLAEQLRELEQEVAEREFTFVRSYGMPTDRRIDPSQLGKLATERLAAVNGARQRIAYDRRTLHGEPVGARRFLRMWREQQRLTEELQAMRPFGA